MYINDEIWNAFTKMDAVSLEWHVKNYAALSAIARESIDRKMDSDRYDRIFRQHAFSMVREFDSLILNGYSEQQAAARLLIKYANLQNKRKAITKKMRFDVLERDGFVCRYCGRKAPDVELEVDHIIPVCEGGPTVLDNLVTACKDCNRGKAGRELKTKE